MVSIRPAFHGLGGLDKGWDAGTVSHFQSGENGLTQYWWLLAALS
jgi:hypothetical protein